MIRGLDTRPELDVSGSLDRVEDALDLNERKSD